MNDQVEGPIEEPRKLVAETETNPVVRKLDLVESEARTNEKINTVDNRQKVGFAVIAAIGTANWLGIKPDPEAPVGVFVEILHRIF